MDSAIMENQVGRYGSLMLMKRLDPDIVLTGFGIDTEELTFGRDTTCDVRLYYPDVSAVHCKIVFQDNKAFLEVYGINGLTVDHCKVFPNYSNPSSPTTVPLSNNSEIEIHNKRFRFAYPPREIRAALLASPATPNRRALRLSMIPSAQVFSPRPSPSPQENLRILKSPLKNPAPSEPDIVLVHGNCPRVVEEEKDLVILEDVPFVPRTSPTPSTPTPILRPLSPTKPRPSLHRAVLIRESQRAILRREMEQEEMREEAEVANNVVSLVSSSSSEDEDNDQHEEGKNIEAADCDGPSWRQNLGRLWPFSSSPVKEEERPVQVHGEDGVRPDAPEEHAALHEKDVDDDMAEADEEPAPLRTPIAPRRQFNEFFTPQVGRGNGGLSGQTRFSLGGGPPKRFSLGDRSPKRLEKSETPPDSGMVSPRKRVVVTEAERLAIKERRKSALATPEWKGRVPGLGPRFSTSHSAPNLPSAPPTILGLGSSTPRPAWLSPTKSAPVERVMQPEDVIDSRTLLGKMQDAVKDIRERQRLSLSPVKGGVWADRAVVEYAQNRLQIDAIDETEEDLDRITQPVDPSTPVRSSTGVDYECLRREMPEIHNSPVAQSAPMEAIPTATTSSSNISNSHPFQRVCVLPSAHESPVQEVPQTPSPKGINEPLEPQKASAEEVADADPAGDDIPGHNREDAPPRSTPKPRSRSARTTVTSRSRGTSTPSATKKTYDLRAGSAEPEEVAAVTKKRTATRSNTKSQDSGAVDVAAPRVTRARSKTPQPQVVDVVPEPQTMTRLRGRRTPKPIESESEVEEIAPTPNTRKTRTTKRTPKQTIKVVEDESDGGEGSVPSTRKPRSAAKRGRTARVPPTVKEEDVERESLTIPAPAKTRGRKKTAAAIDATDGSTALKTTTGRSAAKRTPRTKTPDASSPVLGKENDDVNDEPGPTKVRVSRRGGKKAKADIEDVASESEAVPTRTRVTRTRAART